jgi:hypothetical protein
MTVSIPVAALFVDATGVYASMGLDVWGEARDARLYDGPHPVVAHPPCSRWTRLGKAAYARWGGEHNRPGNDGGCFASALASVRRWGGVLEHPADSYAWPEHGLLKPARGSWHATWCGGYVTEVWQAAYGHAARKRTWLYYVGDTPPAALDWRQHPFTHQVGFQDQRGKAANRPTLSPRDAAATPPEFAEVLVSLALLAVTGVAA